MSHMNFYKSILFLFFFVVAQLTMAQGGATIQSSVDKNKILIGQPMKLTVEVKVPPEAVIEFPFIDTIDHFEILGIPLIDTQSENGGTTIKGVYTITSFDSGHWVLPSFSLSETVKTDTIPVDVLFSPFDPNQEYHDIKDVVDVKVAKNKTEWWWYAAGGALLLAVVIWLVTRKKPRTVAAPVVKPAIDPYEEAIQQLELLNKEKPGAKQYHTRLTDIFRLYVFRKRGILSLQKTTDDLVIQLKGLGLDKEQFDKLSQALRLSDFVKFAKYIPGNEDDSNSFNEIRNAIVTIEKKEARAPL